MEDLGRKPKTHKGKLFLESREPKDKESEKKCIFINTSKSSEITSMILHDLVLQNITIIISLVFNKKESIKKTWKEKYNSRFIYR